MKKLKLFMLALTALFAVNVWADCTTNVMSVAASTDKGKSFTPRYRCTETSGVGYLFFKKEDGSSSWSISSSKVQSSIFGVYTEKALSSITIYGDGTGGNRTLSSVKVGASTDSYSTISVSAVVDGTNDGKFTTSGSADSMIIEYDFPAERFIAITVSGNVNVSSVRLQYCPSCDDPESTIKADTTLFIDDSYNIGFNSINTSGCSIDVKKNGATATEDVDYEKSSVNDYTFLKAGEFVITISQAADAGGHCAVEESVTVTVNAHDPVTTCSISGETAAYKGDAVSFTADAPKATSYKWYVNNVEQASTTAALNYTTSAIGTDSIICKARNEYNSEGEWIADTLVLTVSKLCGMLIKATHTGASTASIDAGSVIGGTYSKNTQSGGKLGSDDHYFGIKLASGNFMPGDTVIITATNASACVEIFSTKTFSSKEDSLNYLNHGTFDANKVYKYVLTTSTEWIYLYRTKTASSSMNPTLGSIEVKRPCKESSDASLATLTVKGEAATKIGNVYSYEVGSSDATTEVTVAYTLNHPLASATPASGFTIDVPDAGDPANTGTITVTAEDGTEVVYTVSVTKAASASTDATLSALSIEGYTLSPVFASNTTAYTITKAYSASMPVVGDVTATPNDANAKGAAVELNDNVFTITVTAEDNTTTKEYTITVNTADARKNLLRATFSNGAIGYMSGNNINVPYLAGETAPTFTSTTFWNADGEPTAEVVDGNLVVTGIDSKTATYTITYVPVTPMELSYDEVTFTAVPSYIYSVYGFDNDKGVKFAKDVEESSNHRISLGYDRIYIALPAAGKVILTSGSGGKRPVKILVNGSISSVEETASVNGTIEIGLSKSQANFISIESNGSNGDGGFTKLQLSQDSPTSLDNTADEVKAVKFIENGQVVIFKDGKYFNVLGIQIR